MIELKVILVTLCVAEFLTLLVRFGFKKKAVDYNVKKMNLAGKKRKIHWHHAYLGIAIVLLSFIFSSYFEKALFSLGLGILFSDIFHHFVFLFLLTGNPDFYLFYKKKDETSARRRLTDRLCKVVPA